MFRKASRPVALPLLLAMAASTAQAQPGPDAAPNPPSECMTGVARAFNAVVPLLTRLQREGSADLGPYIVRLNSLRGRITGGLDSTPPADEACEALALEVSAQRQALQTLLPEPLPAEPPPAAAATPLPVAVPDALPVAPAAPAAVVATAPLAVVAPPRSAAPVRAPERRVVPATALAPVPVKKAAYVLPTPPAQRVDPQLEACRARLRQTHADAQLQLQLAARSGRIAQQKLPEMQRAQGRLAGLSGAVRGEFASMDECQQLAQVLTQEVDQVQALAR